MIFAAQFSKVGKSLERHHKIGNDMDWQRRRVYTSYIFHPQNNWRLNPEKSAVSRERSHHVPNHICPRFQVLS